MTGKRRALGSKKRLSKDRWKLAVTIGYDETGKQVRHYETFRGSSPAADERIVAIAQHFKNTPQAVRKLTFKRFCETKYLPHVAGARRQRTVEGYRSKLSLHVFPRLGDRPLDELRPYDFDELLLELKRDGMSQASLVHVRRVSMQVMNYASDKGFIETWVSRRVSRPRAKPKAKATLTADEAKAYLNLFVDDEVEMAVALGLCAMRPSEICGTQHPDIDLAAGTLHIQRGVHRVKGGFIVEDPKTAESDRTIALTRWALEAYLRHEWVEGFLLQRPNGDPMTVDYVWRRYRKKIQDAGLRYVPWKNLRHTALTLALKAEGGKAVTTRKAADFAGHTTEATTETFYHDRSGVVGRDVVAALDDIYGWR